MYSEGLSKGAAAGLAAALGGFLVFFILIVIAVVVVQIIAMVKVYQKAGKQGWEAIVPFYSTWVLCEIAGVVWWFFLLILATNICQILGLSVLIPLAGLVTLAATFAANYNIAIKFGKDPVAYGIGLTLLPVVFYSILGFGDAKFNADIAVSSYGFIPESKIEDMKSKNATKPETKTETKAETKKETTKTTKKTTKAKFCKNCGAELTDGKFCSNCGAENTQK